MQYIFEDLHGGRIEFSGDELPKDESALIISQSLKVSEKTELMPATGNHVSYSDYYFIVSLMHSFTCDAALREDSGVQQAAAQKSGMLPYQRYFCKAELQWLLPVFGISLRVWLCLRRHYTTDLFRQLMGMVMVKRNWLTDGRKAEEAFKSIKDYCRPVWLVSYLEGTRVSPEKIAEVCVFHLV